MLSLYFFLPCCRHVYLSVVRVLQFISGLIDSSNIFRVVNNFCNAVIKRDFSPVYHQWIISRLWRNDLSVSVNVFINSDFSGNLFKQYLKPGIDLFICLLSYFQCQIHIFAGIINGFLGYALPCCLQPRNCYQDKNMLNYLRCHLDIVDLTHYKMKK